MNILLATALFILLSPGILLTVFPNGKAIFSGKATVKSVLIHAAIFAAVLFAASHLKLEGFQKGVRERLEAQAAGAPLTPEQLAELAAAVEYEARWANAALDRVVSAARGTDDIELENAIRDTFPYLHNRDLFLNRGFSIQTHRMINAAKLVERSRDRGSFNIRLKAAAANIRKEVAERLQANQAAVLTNSVGM